MFTSCSFYIHSILLYTKVAEQAAVQEAVRTWLRCSSNTSLSGYSSVAELYILHVLLPLGQTAQAKELLKDGVGQVAFTEDQRQTALTILENHDAKKMNHSYPRPEPVPVEAEKKVQPQGTVCFVVLNNSEGDSTLRLNVILVSLILRL